MWVRWVCTVLGETKSRSAMSLFGSPSATRRDIALGWGQRQPSDWRAVTFAGAAQRVADGLVARKDGALVPGLAECLVTQRDAKLAGCGVVAGLVQALSLIAGLQFIAKGPGHPLRAGNIGHLALLDDEKGDDKPGFRHPAGCGSALLDVLRHAAAHSVQLAAWLSCMS